MSEAETSRVRTGNFSAQADGLFPEPGRGAAANRTNFLSRAIFRQVGSLAAASAPTRKYHSAFLYLRRSRFTVSMLYERPGLSSSTRETEKARFPAVASRTIRYR